MRDLIELRVTDNRLTELPSSISELACLRELHCATIGWRRCRIRSV
jgi:Leucine-rich repeat (LRR) protein